MSNIVRWRPGLLLGILAAVGMLVAVACGPAAAPTPTPTKAPAAPTATSTTAPAPAVATPTPTRAPVVQATPTPTTAAPPTPTPTKGPQPKRGGIVKENGTEDPPTFDSHNATSSAHNIHNAKLNAQLLWNPSGWAIEPDAAESYQISGNGKVWTFKLRDNVRFHTGYKPAHPRDGTLMTAADVKYSLEKIMGLIDNEVSARSGWMKEFIDIKRPDHGLVVVDNRTLEVHLTQPFAGLANILVINFSSIFPEGTTREMLASRPYAAGPFRLKEFQRGSLWRYERNPDYFKPGLPYLDEMQHVNIKSEPAAQSAFIT
ncbi:MAG: ABC transporter substrate-binding protein, partial [Chloroflexi bacterium]|nr:ABC transporter substrate-binding protein [Chloroflexota bacterium]